MGMLSTAASWLDSTLKASDGVSVVFWRGAASVTLDAVIGMTPFIADQSNGTSVESQSRDYIITSADLIVGGDQIEPEIGDTFKQTIDGFECTFEVLQLPGEQCFRYSDPERQIMRIHTKQIGRHAE